MMHDAHCTCELDLVLVSPKDISATQGQAIIKTVHKAIINGEHFVIDLMHWRHVSITTTPCWGSRLVALRAHVVLEERWRSQSQWVRGPGPARRYHGRYGMQGLARWLHAWRWHTWQCLVWPPTCGGALLWHRDMHRVYSAPYTCCLHTI